MENSTKIYIGVGAAALVAFLLFRNKAVAQKPVVPPVPEKDCPAGQKRVQPNCITAPCPSYCMPKFFDEGLEGFNYGGYGVCPEGTKPCVNNPSKCVSTNPDIRYIKDPCS
jgi:hypothetical protein